MKNDKKSPYYNEEDDTDELELRRNAIRASKNMKKLAEKLYANFDEYKKIFKKINRHIL